MVIERIYIVPLRKEWIKVPKFKRAKKGIKAIKEFMSQHFRIEEKNVKLGRWLNEAIWARGIKNPPHKLKVKAIKDDKGIVRVELFELTEKSKKIEEKESKKKLSIEEKKKAEEEKKKAEEEKAKKEKEEKEKAAKKEEEKEKASEEKEKIEEEKKKLLEKESKEHVEHAHAEAKHVPKEAIHDKEGKSHPLRKTLRK